MKAGIDVGVEAPIGVEVVSRIETGIVVAVVEVEVRVKVRVRVKKTMVMKVVSGTEVVVEVAAPAVRDCPFHVH